MSSAYFCLAHDDGAARAAQGLVGGRGHDVGVGDRRRMQPGHDQPGDVGDVGELGSADLVRNLLELGEVDGARVGRGAGHDDPRLVLERERADGGVVERLGLLVDHVRHDLEVAAGEVERVAVRQVAAVAQVQAEDGVARLGQGQVGGDVGRRAGMGLDVGVVAAEELLGARRWPGSRRRRPTCSRRSSACPGSPRRTCWSAPNRARRAPPRSRNSPKR